MINITEAARDYLLNACIRKKKSAIKLQVKGGGCAGFSYDYNFMKQYELESNDICIRLDEDHQFVVDGLSLMYVIGTTLDYEEKLGHSMLVIKNPNESSRCGCGNSFNV